MNLACFIILIVQFIMPLHTYLEHVIVVLLKLAKDGGHMLITFSVSDTHTYEVFFGHG